eukprot:318461_1
MAASPFAYLVMMGFQIMIFIIVSICVLSLCYYFHQLAHGVKNAVLIYFYLSMSSIFLIWISIILNYIYIYWTYDATYNNRHPLNSKTKKILFEFLNFTMFIGKLLFNIFLITRLRIFAESIYCVSLKTYIFFIILTIFQITAWTIHWILTQAFHFVYMHNDNTNLLNNILLITSLWNTITDFIIYVCISVIFASLLQKIICGTLQYEQEKWMFMDPSKHSDMTSRIRITSDRKHRNEASSFDLQIESVSDVNLSLNLSKLSLNDQQIKLLQLASKHTYLVLLLTVAWILKRSFAFYIVYIEKREWAVNYIWIIWEIIRGTNFMIMAISLLFSFANNGYILFCSICHNCCYRCFVRYVKSSIMRQIQVRHEYQISMKQQERNLISVPKKK